MGAPNSAELVQAIRDKAAMGLRDRVIGEHLGLSKAAVNKIRRNHGIPAGSPHGVPEETVERIRAMALDGASDASIGRAVGMSGAAVQAVRTRRGIEAGLKLKKSEHGTPSMYNRGCRCEPCKTRQRQRAKEQQAKRLAKVQAGEASFAHGLSGYTNWNCRCAVCKAAGSDANRAYWQNGSKRLSEASEASREAHRRQLTERVKAWRDQNRDRVRASNNQRFQDYQAETIGRARKHYYTWTSAELDVVTRDDLSIKEMARMLGRTWSAVHKQRQKQRDAERGKESARPSEVLKHGLGGYSQGCRCEVCAAARREYRKEHEKKVKSETAPGARNARKEWTGPELELAARDDLSVTEIARRLGRTYAAVAVIRHKIRHDPKTMNFVGLPSAKPGEDG